MPPGRDRELLAETLETDYRVETTTDVSELDRDFDCCIIDRRRLEAAVETIQSRQERADPTFLPFLLLLDQEAADRTDAALWEYVDDVVTLPVDQPELLSRVENLVERRLRSVELVEREEQLESTIGDLRTKEAAMDQAPIGITITRIGEDGDAPLIYANEGFRELTGYDDVIGRDCRFLQGEDTDPETVAKLRAAIEAREAVSVDIVNYRKNGQKFWNKLDIAPIATEDPAPRYVGFQADITERKIRERRLEVMNRVLSHNLRNKMNVIEGHSELLRAQLDDEVSARSLSVIEETATDLLRLSESTRDIQRNLSPDPSVETSLEIGEQLRQLVGALNDRFPAAEIELSLPAKAVSASVPGLIRAVEEAAVNAIKHNDSESPTVRLRVNERSEGWVDIEVEDDGPGIPHQEIEVLEAGETDLRHADRLGIWMIYWIARRVGGSLTVTEAEPRGTVIVISVPRNP
ncbi:MAG: PAS domain-containing protein [Halobacteriales archaeon]